jgi:hypothetical protein
MVFLLEMIWSLAMNEYDGHEDLCGSDCQSIIPYVYGRIELLLKTV